MKSALSLDKGQSGNHERVQEVVMTNVMKRFAPPTAVLLMLLASPAAIAGLTSVFPSDAYYDGGTSTIFKTLGGGQVISGRLEYAVYDTQDVPGDFTGLNGSVVPGEGRFVYAYQLILNSTNEFGLTNVGTDYFSVLGISENTLKSAYIGSMSDLAGDPGVAPVSADKGYTEDEANSFAFWEFASGVLEPGTKSFFMLLRSEQGPRRTTFTLIREDNDSIIAPEGAQAPEPAGLLLLAAGTLLARRFRR